MQWNWNPYAIVLILSALVCGGMALFAWPRRQAPGAAPLAVLMLASAVWSLAYAFELGSVDLAGAVLAAKIEYIGIVVVSPALLILVLQHAGRDRLLTRRNLFLLSIIPAVTLVLVWTNEHHYQFWTEAQFQLDSQVPAVTFVYGPGFWFHTIFSYLCLLASTTVLLHCTVSSPRPYSTQAGLMLAGSLIPWTANAAHVFDLTLLHPLDLTPFAFIVTGLFVSWGLFRFELLRSSPMALRSLIDHAGIGMIALDTRSRIVEINPAALLIVGRPRHDLLGYSAEDAFPDHPALLEILQVDGEIPTLISLGPPEAQSHFAVRSSQVIDSKHRSLGRIVTLHDTTALVQTEQALRDSQNQLRLQNAQLLKLSQAVEQSANMVVITDLEGTIEYVNPRFEQVTGYSIEEVIGQNPRILKSGHQDEDFYRSMWQTIVIGDEWSGEFRNRRKDGKLYWEQATIAPIRDSSGQMSHFIAVKEEITARKQAEEALRLHTEELQHRNAELDAFAHTVAHDIKNPVSTMLGYAEMLEQERLSLPEEVQQELLASMVGSGLRLARIIDEILLLSSVRGMEEVELSTLNMSAIVNDAIGRIAPMIYEYHGEIALPEVWPDAIGYGPWIEEVWVNYISNALKYGGQPPLVELGYSFEPPAHVDANPDGSSEPGIMLRFWVRDNGSGLNSDQRQRLFTPFERLYQVRTTGHGLGLSIVQRIVHRLGGRVGVECSDLGPDSSEAPDGAQMPSSRVGCEFYFILPSAHATGEKTDEQACPVG